MSQINAYLTFDGRTREAMTFYKDCLGGELSLLAVKDSPMAGQWPDEVQEKILHASLVKGPLTLLASDMKGAEKLVRGNTISLALSCSSEEEISACFEKLSAGGKVSHPLHKFFDGTIGALTDKFGMNWVLKL